VKTKQEKIYHLLLSCWQKEASKGSLDYFSLLSCKGVLHFFLAILAKQYLPNHAAYSFFQVSFAHWLCLKAMEVPCGMGCSSKQTPLLVMECSPGWEEI